MKMEKKRKPIHEKKKVLKLKQNNYADWCCNERARITCMLSAQYHIKQSRLVGPIDANPNITGLDNRVNKRSTTKRSHWNTHKSCFCLYRSSCAAGDFHFLFTLGFFSSEFRRFNHTRLCTQTMQSLHDFRVANGETNKFAIFSTVSLSCALWWLCFRRRQCCVLESFANKMKAISLTYIFCDALSRHECNAFEIKYSNKL